MNAPKPPTHLRIILLLLRIGFLYAIVWLLLYPTAYELTYQRALSPLATLSQSSPITHWRTAPAHQSPITQLPNYPITNPPLPFLGITTHLEQYTATERAAALNRLHNSGFRWVRQRLDWGRLELQPGTFDWETSDAIIDAIVAADLVPVIVLDGSPAWARAPQDVPPTDNPYAPPADFRDFARFAIAFADRYGDRVDFYQLWDEPNIAPHWGNRLIEPVGYAQLLRVGATAIRSADPHATIIAAALAPTRDRGHTAIDEFYYLERLYAAGAAPYFDVLAIQPFGFSHAPTNHFASADRLNFARAQLVRRVMLAAGDGATPVWAVRYGWNSTPSSPWGSVGIADQQEFATGALAFAQTEWPWLTAMAWAVDQPAAPPADPLWGFALTDELAEAFAVWTSEGVHAGAQDSQRSGVEAWQIGSLYSWWPWVGVLLVVWRMGRLAGRLPWTHWDRRYQGWPSWGRTLLWTGLLLTYYFATVPPLIVTCWIAATVLLRWQPAVGLYLAAFFIPFHAYHKELTIAGWTIAVAPSHALLLCLAVVQFQRLWAYCACRGRPTDLPVNQETFGPSPPTCYRKTILTFLPLAWLLLSLAAAANVWHWPAYRTGLWDLAVMPLLGFGVICVACCVSRACDLPPAPAHEFPGDQLRVLPLVSRIAIALYLGGVAVAAVGLFQWATGRGTAVDGLLRLVGPYFSPNQAALYLERTLFVGLGLALYVQQRGRTYTRWLWGTLGLVVGALLLTASRGALLLGVPAGMVVFLWLGSSKAGSSRSAWEPTTDALRPEAQSALAGRARAEFSSTSVLRTIARVQTNIWLWAVLFCGIAVLSLALYTGFGERLTNSATLVHRLTIWQSSLALWSDFLWLGVGPGGFFWRYPAYLPIGVLDEPNLYHPHNLWLEVATGWGLLGLVWLGLVGWWLIGTFVVGRSPGGVGTWRHRPRAHLGVRTTQGSLPLVAGNATPQRRLTAGLLAALAAGFAHGQVDAFLALPDLALWFWLVLALVTVGQSDGGTVRR